MRILYAGTRRSREMRWCAAIYATVSVVLTALFLLLNANLAKKTGVNRIMYPEIEFGGVPLFADVSQDTTLDFLDETPGLPRRFFSVRWEGFWYVPGARPFTLHGAGDDRLDVWVDGELVIHRGHRPTCTQKPALWQWKLVFTSYALSISNMAVTGTLGSNGSLTAGCSGRSVPLASSTTCRTHMPSNLRGT